MHPTAYADQFSAATRDATHMLSAAIAAGWGDEQQPDPWITTQAEALIRTLTAGITHPCPHIGSCPQLAQAAVWAPGRLACPPCAPILLAPSPVEDLTCDQCRQPSPTLHAGMVTVGPVLLAYGRCPTCQHHAQRWHSAA